MKKLVIVFGLLLALSCGENTNSTKPGAIGKIGEVLVIAENKDWNSELGDTIRSIFQKSYPMLPQSETSFNLLQMVNSSFISTMQKHRNILLISISAEQTEAKLTISKDLWAAPQIVLNAVGPDRESVLQVLLGKKDITMKLFEQAELERQSDVAVKYSDPIIHDTISKSFGINLHIPTGFYLMRSDVGFMWFESQTNNSSTGIFIYTYPSNKDSIASINYLVNKRDSILKEKVHGARDSSWMITTEFLLPEIEIKKDGNNKQYSEMHGLWELVNDYMGGPFVSRSYIDATGKNIITIEGYVYAPGDKKRDRIRKIMGIMNTFKDQVD